MKKSTRSVITGTTLSSYCLKTKENAKGCWLTKPALLLSILLLSVCSRSMAQYTQVTNTSGTTTYAGIGVTVTSSGSVSSAYGCTSTVLGPYWMVSGGTYTFTFSPAVSSVEMPVVINGEGFAETASFTVNGSAYSVTSANIISNITPNCGDNTLLVASGGNLTNTGDLSGEPTALVRLAGAAGFINSVSITFTGDYILESGMFIEPNRVPTFVNGSPQSLSVCQGSSLNSINSLLQINDADTGQTETWTVFSGPTHGTIGTGGTQTSTGGNITPTGFSYTPTPAGYSGTDAFTIHVSDGAGGVASTTINVTVNPLPVAGTVSGGPNVCAGSSTLYSDAGGANGTGTWSSTNTAAATVNAGGTVFGAAAGTATIIFTETSGFTPACGSATASATVTVNPLPIAGTVSGGPNVCAGSSTLYSDAGAANGTGAWSSTNTAVATVNAGGTVFGASAGTATIVFTETSGFTPSCGSATSSAGVTVNPVPVAGTVSGANVCLGSSTVFNDAGAANGTGTWSSTNTSVATVNAGGTVFSVGTGTSSIVFTETSGFTPSCGTATANAPVTVNPLPVAGTVSGGPNVCAGSSTLYSDAGSANGTGVWSSTNTAAATVNAGGTVFGASAGTASIVFTVTSGFTPSCGSATSSAGVTVNPIPVSGTVSGGPNVCAGSSTLYSDAGAANGTGTWSSTNTAAATVNASGTVFGVSAGTSTIVFTETSGFTPSCGSATSSAPVTVNPLPIAGTVSGGPNVCAGSATVYGDAGAANGTGTWSTGNASVATVDPSGTVYAVSAGTTNIIFTETSGFTPSCGSTTATAPVTVNPLPVAGTVSGANVCLGSTTIFSDAGGANGTGTWSTGNAAVATVDPSGTVYSVSAGTTTVIYTVTSGFTPSCGSAVASAPVTVNPLPAAGTVSGGPNVCAGSSTVYSDAGAANGTGTWSSTNTSVATVNAGGTVFGASAGTASIIFTETSGFTPSCGSASNSAPVTVNPLPVAGTVSGGPSVCVGSTTLYSDAGSANGTGTWSSSNTSVATVDASGNVWGASAGTASIVFTVTSGFTPGCGSAIASAPVTVNPLPIAGTVSGGPNVCAGSSTLYSDAGAANGTGTWSSTNTAAATVNAGGTVFGVSAGTSTIVFTETSGFTPSCGVVTSSAPVTVNPLPIAGTVGGGPNVCAGSTTVYSDAGAANGTGTWSSTNTSVATVNAGGTVFGVSAGTASIIFTETSGFTPSCGSATASAPVTVNPLPIAGTVSGANVCLGSTTVFSDAGGANGTGTWSTGNAAVATVDPSGTVYSVSTGTTTVIYTVTSGFTPSCGSATASAPVTVNPLPVAGTVSGGPSICAGFSAVYSDAGAANGTGTWSSTNTTVATVNAGGTVFAVSAGTSSIVFTVTSGFTPSCGSASGSAPVTVNALPSANTGNTPVCAGSSFTLTNTASGTWSSSNTAFATVTPGPATTTTVTGVSAGSLTVTFTLPSGCVATTAVTVNPLPVAGTVSGGPNVCAGSSTLYSDAGAANGTGVWSSTNTSVATVNAGGTVFGASAGTSSIVFTVTSGFSPSCGSATSSAPVTVNPLPVAGTVSGGPNVCAGSSTLYSDAGAANGTGVWSSTNTSVATVNAGGTVFGASAGTASIVFTETSGFTPSCGSATSSAGVTVNPVPVAGTVSGSNVCLGSTTVFTDAGAANGTGTWSSSNNSVATVDASGNVYSVSTGTASIIFTETSGFTPSCGSATSSATVTVNPLPVAGTVSGGPNVCAGSNTLYSDAGGANGTVVWSSTNTTVATVNAGGTVFGVSAGTASIVYTITSTFTPSCGSATTSAPVTVNPVPVAGTVSGSNVCLGNTTVFTDAGAANGTTAWSSSNNSVATVDASGNVYSVSAGTSSIIYTVTSGFTPSCGTATASKTITVNPLPVSGTVSGGPNVCVGSNTAYSDAGAANGTMVWSSSNTAVATVNGAGTVFGASAGTASIIYTVTSAFTPSCGVVTSSVPVTVNPLPVAGTLSGTNVCLGSTTTLTDAGGANGTGTWSSTNTSVATVDGSGNVYSVSTGTTSIVYTVTSGFTPSCGSASTSKTVTVNPLPVSGTVSGGPIVCMGSTTLYTDAGAANGTGTWSSSNNSIATVDPTGVVSGVSAGTASIIFTETSGFTPSCGSTTSSAPVTVNLTPSTITGGAYACLGEAKTLSDAVTGGVWSSSNTAQASIGSATGIVTGGTLGSTPTITYTLPDACNATLVISVSPLPSTAFAITGGGTYCGGGAGPDIGLSGSASGINYQLFNGPSPLGSPLAGSGTGLDFGDEPSPGTYTVTGTNTTTGCYSTMSGSVTVSINPAPAVYTVSGGGTNCAGGTGFHILLSNSGFGVNYQLLLNGTATGTSIAGDGAALDMGLKTAAGTYRVVAINGTTGCSDTMSGSAVITVIPGPAVNNVTGTGSYCAGGTGIAVGLNGSVAGISYQLYLNGVSTGLPVVSAGGPFTFATETAAGTYTVIATNTTTGCTSAMAGSAVITINSLPTVYTLTGGGSYCTGGTGVHVGLSGSAAGVSYQLYSSTGTAGSAVAGTGTSIDFGLHVTAGIRFAVATNAAGCSDTMSGIVTVSVNPLPAVDTVTGGGSFCAGGTGVHVGLNTSSTGINYQLYIGSTLIDAAAGTGSSVDFGLEAPGSTSTYTAIATNATTTCSVNMFGSATVTVNPLPAAFTVTGGGNYCVGGTGVSVILSGSTPGVSYQLLLGGVGVGSAMTGGGGSVNFGLQTATGTYTVLATNSTSCMKTMTGSVAVGLFPLPFLHTVTGGGSYCAGGTGVHVDLNASDAGISYQLYDNGTVAAAPQSGTGVALDFGLQTATGTYTVIATNVVTMCTVNMLSSVTVTTNPLPAVYLVKGGGSYCAGGTGVHDSLSNSAVGISYQLFNGVSLVGSAVPGTGFPIDFGAMITAGVYTVVAINSSTSCTSNMSGSATITINPLPTVFTVTGGGSYCPGGAGVHVGLSSSTAGVNYQLYFGGSALGAPHAGTGSAIDFGTETGVGSYTVIATNTVTGCTSTMLGSAVVNTNLSPAVYAVTGGGSYCFGGTGLPVGLSNSVIGINYQLYSGGFAIGSPQSGIGSAISFGLQTAAGSYTVVATNTATGCTSNMSGGATITINPLPPLHSVTGGGSYCTGGTGIHIGLNGSDAGVNYQLFNGITPVGTTVAGTGVGIDFGLQTLAGTYTVVATNTTTGCINNMTGIVSVSLYPLPIAYSVTGGGNFCSGGTGVHVGLSSSNTGVTYQLFNGFTPLLILSGTGLPLDFGLQTGAGAYTVVATNSTTSCTSNMSGSVAIVTDPLPAAHTVTGGGNYCSGGTGADIGLNGSDTGNTYELFYGGSPVGLPVTGTGSSLDFGTHLAGGTYTIVATTTATGCNSNMAGNAVITINPLPVTYTVSGGGSYCAGGGGADVGLTSSSTGVSYQLYVGVAVAGSPLPGTGSALDFGLQSTAGTYTVVATNDTTFCTKIMNGSVTISINPLPFAYTVTGGGNYCPGGTGVNVGLSGSDAGMSYQLQVSGVNTGSAIAGTGSTIDFGSQTATGSYSVIAANTSTGCTNTMSGSVSVSFNALPTVYTLTSAASYYCIGGAGVDLSLSGSDIGTTYQLYVGGTAVGIPVPGSGAALDLGLQTAAGTYTVVATSASGCTSNMTSSVTVTINLPPFAYSVLGGGSYCAGGSGVHIGLSGSAAGISYQLYNGISAAGSPVMGTGAPIDFGLQTLPGSYTVIATNGATTCVTSMTGSATVVINPLPAVSTVTGGGNYCMGSGGVDVGLSGSQAGVTYQLINGVFPVTTLSGTGSALDFGLQTAAGTYTVIASNTATGCSSSMAGSAPVVINALPTAYVVTGGGNYCPGSTGVSVGLAGSDIGIIYQLYNGATAIGAPMTGSGAALDFGLQTLTGVYTVKATNTSTTCTGGMTGSVTVGLNPAPTPYSVTGGGNYCVGSAGVSVGLANSATGVSYQLYFDGVLSGIPITGTGAPIEFGLQTAIGNYTVTASDLTTACTDNMTGMATVGTNPLVAPAVTLVSGVSDTICAGTPVSIATLVTNGGATPTFQWYLNGVPTPFTGSSYPLTPSNGDSVSVAMTSSAACATPATVYGSLQPFTVQAHGMPTISITDYPGDHVCQGTTVTFTASTTFGGPAPALSWTVNGVSEGIDSTYSYIPGNDDYVVCTLTSDYHCRLANTATSNLITMRADPAIVPSVSVTAHPSAYITPGENTLLTAIDANDAVSPTYQWYLDGVIIPGATLSTYVSGDFSNLDSVTCVVTSGGYCSGLQGAGSIIIHFSNTGVNQVATTVSDINLVPNPNKGIFTIKGTLGTTTDEQVSLEITDMLGQVVYKDNITAHGGNLNEKIQLSNTVANGMYILNLRSGSTNNVFHVVIEQ